MSQKTTWLVFWPIWSEIRERSFYPCLGISGSDAAPSTPAVAEGSEAITQAAAEAAELITQNQNGGAATAVRKQT